ncbi:MAG: hypothetical protein IPG69_07375 [Flavobacteriales bacterium]|nr:hypothetical protein [Flavobacteriales bacterium]
MPTAKRTTVLSPAAAAEAQIAKLISKYEVEDQKLIQAVREFLQKRFPTANELVYDYARNFVIGYSPTAAGSEGIAALSADADGVRLYLRIAHTWPIWLRQSTLKAIVCQLSCPVRMAQACAASVTAPISRPTHRM